MMNQPEIRQFFIDRYPQKDGHIFYWSSLLHLEERLKHRLFTLELVHDCIQRDPFVLKYILCIDNRCGNPKQYHHMHGGMIFCDHAMNHQWFEDKITEQRAIMRKIQPPHPQPDAPVIYPTIEHMNHAISEAFDIAPSLLCEDKMKVWYRYLKTGKILLGALRHYCGRYGQLPRYHLENDPFRLEYCFYARNNARKKDFMRMVRDIRKYYSNWQWDEDLVEGMRDIVQQHRKFNEHRDHDTSQPVQAPLLSASHI